MILQSDEFKIENDGIWISKKAIEEFRTQVRYICYDEDS
jgi:hypothetical protein